MRFLGHYAANSTVSIPYTTNDSNGASITKSTDGTVAIYKGTNATQRTSASGVTDSEDFDSVTGVHMLSIDTSDNADSGFYAVDTVYHVMLNGAVIDGQTVNHWLGSFAIGNLIGATTSVLSNANVLAITNMALISLGEPEISDIDADIKSARMAKSIYSTVRDTVLASHPWASASKHQALTDESTNPTSTNWSVTFGMPTDFIRFVNPDLEGELFALQGNKILSNESSLTIEYIYQLDDPSIMSVWLKETIAAKLASELSLPLTGKSDRQKAMWEIYQEKLRMGRYYDSSHRDQDAIKTENWTSGRIGGASGFRPISS